MHLKMSAPTTIEKDINCDASVLRDFIKGD